MSNIFFYGSGASGAAGNPQTDTSQWTGGFRASTQWAATATLNTLAQSASNRNRVELAAIAGPLDVDRSLVGAWLLVRNGPAGGFFSRIANYQASNNAVLLEEPTPAALTGSEAVGIYLPGNVFPNVSADASVNGEELYRGVFIRNETGGNLVNFRVHMVDKTPPDHSFRYGMADNEAPSDDMLTIASETSPPVDERGWLVGGPGFFSPSDFRRAPSIDAPILASTNFSDTEALPAYVGRIIEPREPLQRSASVAIHIAGRFDTQSPTAFGGDLIVYEVEGFEASVAYSFARNLHVKGGARGECLLTQAGQPVSGVPIRFGVIGPGSQNAPDEPADDYGLSDEDGRAQNAYFGPETEQSGFVTGFAQAPSAEPIGQPSSVSPTPTLDFGSITLTTSPTVS